VYPTDAETVAVEEQVLLGGEPLHGDEVEGLSEPEGGVGGARALGVIREGAGAASRDGGSRAAGAGPVTRLARGRNAESNAPSRAPKIASTPPT
jgi:hypothetical protein